jgi:nucleotide-binding universal stress UspA family protein
MNASASSSPPPALLLATDLGPRCDRALDRCVQLARQWNAPAVALTVVDPSQQPPLRPFDRQPQPSPLSVAERRLRCDLAGSPVAMRVRVEQGDVADKVIAAAQAEGSGLVVTGVARHEALSRIVLGSTVDALARRLPVPLLVVRCRVRGPYLQVRVATDFSDAARHALEQAARLFPQARFTVFHAFGNPYPVLAGMDAGEARRAGHDAAQREMLAWLAEADLPQDTRDRIELALAYGDAAHLLSQHGERCPEELIVMGTRGRGALATLLLGSTAQRALEMAEGDMLVIPPARDA